MGDGKAEGIVEINGQGFGKEYDRPYICAQWSGNHDLEGAELRIGRVIKRINARRHVRGIPRVVNEPFLAIQPTGTNPP